MRFDGILNQNYLYRVLHLFSYSSRSSTEKTVLYSILHPAGKNEGLDVGLEGFLPPWICCWPKPWLAPPLYWGLAQVEQTKMVNRHNVFMFKVVDYVFSDFQVMFWDVDERFIYTKDRVGPSSKQLSTQVKRGSKKLKKYSVQPCNSYFFVAMWFPMYVYQGELEVGGWGLEEWGLKL